MKRRFVFHFPLTVADEPITYLLIAEYHLKLNILKASISPEKGGDLLVELEGSEADIERGLAYLRGRGISIEAIDKKILFRREECVHCGACTATCFTGALAIGAPDWELRFDPERCVACELCLKSCPLRLFELRFG